MSTTGAKSRWWPAGAAVAILAAVAVVWAVSRQDGGTAGDGASRPLTIGADLTLTGPTAFWSQQIQKGLDVAVDEANGKAGARKVRVVYQDNQGNPAAAVSVFQRLVDLDGASVVVTCFTPIAKPLRETAASAKVPLLATVVSANDFGLANEWSFRDFPPQDQQATALARHSYGPLGLRKVAALIVNDDYGRDGYKAFSAEFAKLGGSVTGFETMDQKDNDVRAQVTKLLAAGPDGILAIVRDTALGLATKQLREAQFRGKIVGVNAFDSPDVLRAAGQSVEGVVFTSVYIDPEGGAESRAFLDAYRARFSGEEPDSTAIYGYTIGQYVADNMRKVGGDPAKLRDALSVLDRDSIRGHLTMNTRREVLGPIGIYEYQGGRKRLIEKVNAPAPASDKR